MRQSRRLSENQTNLLHDIHLATVAALPGLLKELRDHGHHIV